MKVWAGRCGKALRYGQRPALADPMELANVVISGYYFYCGKL
jgi:hypothetical protein